MICNLKRKWDLVSHVIDVLPLPPPARAFIVDCLVDKSALRRINAEARFKVCCDFILGYGFIMVRNRSTGVLRELDTDDEDDDGLYSPYYNFVNIFWKLQLSYDTVGKKTLFTRVIQMIGPTSSPG